MNRIIKRYPLLSKRIVIAAVFLLLVFSCSENTETPTNNSAKFCAIISWCNSFGISGNFKEALLNSSYGLTSASVTDDGTTTATFYRDASGHLINGSGFAYTYTYDTNDYVATMVHTGNPNNIYTFTHSDCN